MAKPTHSLFQTSTRRSDTIKNLRKRLLYTLNEFGEDGVYKDKSKNILSQLQNVYKNLGSLDADIKPSKETISKAKELVKKYHDPLLQMNQKKSKSLLKR